MRPPWREGTCLASVPQPTPALFLSHFEVYKYLFFASCAAGGALSGAPRGLRCPRPTVRRQGGQRPRGRAGSGHVGCVLGTRAA